MTQYTVYLLHERLSQIQLPYVGMTENIKERARDWKRKLKLEIKPQLEVIAVYDNHDEAFEHEQALRVINGWPRERNPKWNQVLHQIVDPKKAQRMQLIGLAKRGIPQSPEHIAARSLARTGKKYNKNR